MFFGLRFKIVEVDVAGVVGLDLCVSKSDASRAASTASSPSEEAMGGLWSKFEPIRTASRHAATVRNLKIRTKNHPRHREMEASLVGCSGIAGRSRIFSPAMTAEAGFVP